MNKKSLIIVFFVLFISGLSGQQKDEFGVHLNAEKMPIIEGGMAAIGKKITPTPLNPPRKDRIWWRRNYTRRSSTMGFGYNRNDKKNNVKPKKTNI